MHNNLLALMHIGGLEFGPSIHVLYIRKLNIVHC